MFRLLKNKCIFTLQCKTPTSSHINNMKYIKSETYNQTEIKSEEEIKQIISLKMKEYQELIKTQAQSVENQEINAEINILDTKLRKSFGFSKDEDLTLFPVFKFDEPEIDNQLD